MKIQMELYKVSLGKLLVVWSLTAMMCLGGERQMKNKNFASAECGAHVLQSNPEAAMASAILSDSRDTYLLSPCAAPASFVIELCEEIGITELEMGNLEYFSSNFKDFTLLGKHNDVWVPIDNFSARNVKELQSFPLAQPAFHHHIMINITSNFGNEHYCPISIVRVRGLSLFDSLRLELEVDQEEESFGQVFNSPPALVLYEQIDMLQQPDQHHSHNFNNPDHTAAYPHAHGPVITRRHNSKNIATPADFADLLGDLLPEPQNPLPGAGPKKKVWYCAPEVPIMEMCPQDFYIVQQPSKPNENILKTLASKVKHLEMNQTAIREVQYGMGKRLTEALDKLNKRLETQKADLETARSFRQDAMRELRELRLRATKSEVMARKLEIWLYILVGVQAGMCLVLFTWAVIRVCCF